MHKVLYFLGKILYAIMDHCELLTKSGGLSVLAEATRVILLALKYQVSYFTSDITSRYEYC